MDFQKLEDHFTFFNLAPLDAFSEDELATHFRPAHGELPISSMNRSGQRILVSSSALVPELHKAIKEAETEDLNAVVLSCTGEFDLGKTTLPLLLPGQLLRDKVQSYENLLKMVAVLVPVDEQQEPLTARWIGRLPENAKVQAFTMSPQVGLETCRELGESLAASGFHAAIMDCFGYSLDQHAAIKDSVSLTFSAKAVAIDALKELRSKTVN